MSVATYNIFTFKNPRIQQFDLPSTLIFYIYTNLKSVHDILELYQTCKYFYSKRKIIFLQYGAFRNGFREDYDTPLLKKNNEEKIPICICRQLNIYGEFSHGFNEPWCYEMTNLLIVDATLTFTDFEVLVSNNSVKDFSWLNSSLTYLNGEKVPVIGILETLPYLISFEYENFQDICAIDTTQKHKISQITKKLSFYRICYLDLGGIRRQF